MNAQYITPRDLAKLLGQSPRTVRRVLAEAGIEKLIGHWPGSFWRFDLKREADRLAIDKITRLLANSDSKRRFGCRRRRTGKKEKAVQMEMMEVQRVPVPKQRGGSRPSNKRAQGGPSKAQMRMFE